MDHPKTPTGEFPRHLPDCKCATCTAAEDKRRRAWERLETPERTAEIEHVAGAYVRQLIVSGHLVREDGKPDGCGAYECHEHGCKRAGR